MKIVLLLADTLSNRYLIKKMREHFDIIGIVIQEEAHETIGKKLAGLGTPLNIVKHIFLRLLTRRSFREGRALEERYFSLNGKPYPLPEGVPVIRTKNINENTVRDFIMKLAPDLVAVSGTQLLRQPLLSLSGPVIKKGIINMHTGLSPYIRGGNASFWALYAGKPHYIGVTIHYIDKDIDKGDIILSARPDDIEEDDTDFTLDVKVRALGIGLYVKAIQRIEQGANKRVPQWPGGQLFAIKTGHTKTLEMIYALRKKLKKENILKQYLENKQRYDGEVVIVS